MPSTTATIPLHQRPTSHPLSSYLLRLMLLKSSNLCLSADVSSASALLDLAATVGPSIVILKTHFDILPDWDSHPRTGTGAKLAALARRHGFLLFEDRKFSDIGSTVQKQYVEGPGRIVEWAHITNAHVLPGAAIVTSLGSAAAQWRERRRQVPIRTDISADAPQLEGGGADEKRRENDENDDERTRYAGIEEAPLERGLLLLAQMSSAENFFTPDYTKACVKIARANQDFVMGFISQESLNTTSEDHFLSMTPGCQLPAEGETAVSGDGLGQQYNTPQKIVEQMGNDIIIVGRGIIKAADPLKEAERYREKGWKAYLTRIKS